MPAPKNDQSTKSSLNAYLAITAGVALAVVGLVWWLTRSERQTPTTQPTAQTATIPTPESYTDFVGKVTTIEGSTLAVAMTRSTDQGTMSVKTYTITIDQSTELRTVEVGSDDTRVSDLALTNVKPDDLVQVYANQNIAEVQEFTATRILKLVQIN